jgi:hypothetical protein
MWPSPTEQPVEIPNLPACLLTLALLEAVCLRPSPTEQPVVTPKPSVLRLTAALLESVWLTSSRLLELLVATRPLLTATPLEMNVTVQENASPCSSQRAQAVEIQETLV